MIQVFKLFIGKTILTVVNFPNEPMVYLRNQYKLYNKDSD